jgi:16S rRNA (cytosine967-C5)-methyltransferase
VARARALLEPPSATFRLNPRVSDALARAEAAGLAPRPLPVPGAWQAAEGRVAELAEVGVIYPQDEGSQMVALLAVAEGVTLDACAAPGGKALLLGDEIGGRGLVIAGEGSKHRARTLAKLIRRWGSRNVLAACADVLRPPFRRRFASVLVDAPCSGLGTLSRHPDIRWRANPADLARHADRQREMLAAAAPLVAEGGKLVYATCSSEPEENEGVVEAFLTHHPDFVPEALPGWASSFADGLFAYTLPERASGDAFFAAVLRRG